MRPREPLEIRYERHINRMPDGCWLWVGPVASSGYPQFRLGRSNKTISVHRWAFERWVGPIPPGHHVLHRCDNPRCSRPEHLFSGTAADNVADKIAKGRQPRGHKRTAVTRRSKLTDDQVREIRCDDRKAHDIAKIYGIAEQTVWGIKARRRKQYVPD